MVTDLQYIAIAAFLLWGLAASLAGVFANNPDAARLVWRRRDTKPKPKDDAEIRLSARPSSDPRTGI